MWRFVRSTDELVTGESLTSSTVNTASAQNRFPHSVIHYLKNRGNPEGCRHPQQLADFRVLKQFAFNEFLALVLLHIRFHRDGDFVSAHFLLSSDRAHGRVLPMVSHRISLRNRLWRVLLSQLSGLVRGNSRRRQRRPSGGGAGIQRRILSRRLRPTHFPSREE